MRHTGAVQPRGHGYGWGAGTGALLWHAGGSSEAARHCQVLLGSAPARAAGDAGALRCSTQSPTHTHPAPGLTPPRPTRAGNTLRQLVYDSVCDGSLLPPATPRGRPSARRQALGSFASFAASGLIHECMFWWAPLRLLGNWAVCLGIGRNPRGNRVPRGGQGCSSSPAAEQASLLRCLHDNRPPRPLGRFAGT